jgi:hypothetical protein
MDFEDAEIMQARQEVPTYYQKLDATKEFAETFYYGIKAFNQNSGLV